MNVAFHSNSAVALITGASGFTGRYVMQRMTEAGYQVHGWSRIANGDPRIKAVDLLNLPEVHSHIADLRPAVVVHLAAIPFVAHGDVDELYRLNIVGTRNLLDGLCSCSARPYRVVLASSANVYGNVGGIISEQTPLAPQNDYAVSKLAMEYMAELWADKLPITVTRPFNYTGVGQSVKFLLPKIVEHFKTKASVIELGNLDVSRDFYDVRGVADVVTRLVATNASGKFNICSGKEYSLNEVICLMEKISNHSLEVRVNPAFVRGNEVRSLRGDNKKLIDCIGNIPEFSLEDTLRWMFES
ncbi:NAD-dependent epimerase/dehydratase family protein [Xanthomonas euvesicatoria]|uniref:NAD-dependent epimerase/dehydratase family protein n=1 Tax=Xanthomonas TaxID=338 RepID=UPI0035581FD2